MEWFPHKVKKIESKNALYWYQLAKTLNKQKKYAESIEAYKKCLELDPHFTEYKNNPVKLSIAIRYKKLKQLDSAIQYANVAAKELIEQKKHFHHMSSEEKQRWDIAWKQLCHNRGMIYLARKEYDNAIADFSSGIDAGSLWEGTYRCRAKAWLQKGEHEKALVDINKAIKYSKGKVASCYLIRYQIYRGLDKLKEAMESINQAIAIRPKATYYYYCRAEIWEQHKNWAKAMEDYIKISEIDPQDDICKQQITRLKNLMRNKTK
jgi:tetratricopeptide (TPR) repeat protein